MIVTNLAHGEHMQIEIAVLGTVWCAFVLYVLLVWFGFGPVSAPVLSLASSLNVFICFVFALY